MDEQFLNQPVMQELDEPSILVLDPRGEILSFENLRSYLNFVNDLENHDN